MGRYRKNDRWTSECGKRGNMVVLKKYRKLGRVFKKNDPWTIKCREKSHETRRNLGHYSKMGKFSRFYENKAAKQLNSSFEKVWQPNEICDRIAIKNGRVFFIEIKTGDRSLSPKQEEFRRIVKSKFIVLRTL